MAANEEKCEELAAVLKKDFPLCAIHATSNPQDGVDFCRANVYDLIVIENGLRGMKGEETVGKIREMGNDNLTSGIILIAPEGESSAPGLKSMDHVMVTKAPFCSEDYLPRAKVLLSLKD